MLSFPYKYLQNQSPYEVPEQGDLIYLTDTFSKIILQQNDKRNVFFVIKLTYIKIPRKLVTKQNEW